MLKKTCYLLFTLLWAVILVSCGYPSKPDIETFSPCVKGRNAATGGVKAPYNKLDATACTATINSYDLGVWQESAYNSHKVRGENTVTIGCTNLTPTATAGQGYTGVTGRSKTVMASFDLSRYPADAIVQRAVIAFHAPKNPNALISANLRGRLNIGDNLQSLAATRNIAAVEQKSGGGWVFYDITHFAARAINERRNAVQFELSLPCQNNNSLAEVSLLSKEPLIIVEYK